MAVSIVFYAPPGTALATAPLTAVLSEHFDGSDVHVSLSKRHTPCVLATITDDEAKLAT